jgi:hypothetical protein
VGLGNARRCEPLCGPGKGSGWLVGDGRERRVELDGGAPMAGRRSGSAWRGGLHARGNDQDLLWAASSGA